MLSLAAPPHRSRLLAAVVALSLVATGQLMAVTPAYAASPEIITVASTADPDLPATCSSAALDSPVTLRGALCYANQQTGPVEVVLPTGNYTLVHGSLLIGTKAGADITVRAANGAKPTITGDKKVQVMTLDPFVDGGKPVGNVTVRLSGLTITDGVDNLYGGGAISGGSYFPEIAKNTLVVTDSTINGNKANTTANPSWNPGGGIQFMGGSLTITNSTFSNNSAGSSPGGAIAYQAVGITGESLKITGSTFSGNSVTTAGGPNGGGALAIDDIGGLATMTISDSIFMGNAAQGTADAVGSAIWQRSGKLSLTTSTITNNIMSGPATFGALQIDNGTFTAHYNRIVGNVDSFGLAVPSAGPIVDAKNNWWGCKPGASGCTAVSATNVPSIAQPYLTLTATAATTPVVHPVKTTTVTASVLKNSEDTMIDPANLGVLAGLPVVWGKALPSGAAIAPASSTLSGGLATSTFDARTTEGPGSATAALDGFEAQAALAIHTPPSITSGAAVNFVVGATSTSTITTSGYPKPALTLNGTLPKGLLFTDKGDGTATIAGNADAGTGEDYVLTVKAKNSAGTAPDHTLTLHVGEAPGFSSPNAAKFTVGKSGSVDLTTSGFPDSVIAHTAGTLPSGVTFTPNANGTATLSGTPAPGTGGIHGLTFTAANGINPGATQTFTLTVNEPVVIVRAPSAQIIRAGDTVMFTAAASGFPAPTVQWQVSINGGSSFTNLSDETGVILAFPAKQSENGYQYRAVFSNGTTATTNAAELTVHTAPAITSAAAATFTVNGTSQSFSLVSTGSPRSTLSLGAGAPDWLALVDNGDGTATISGTPRAGNGGVATFTVTASNGFGSPATQAFTLTTTESPSLPSTAAVTFVVGTSKSHTISTTLGEPQAVTLSQQGVLPTGLSFVDNHDGTATLSGTAAPSTGKVYPLTVIADNGIAPNATQELTLTVVEAPVVTTDPVDAEATVGSAVSFTAAATGFPVPTVQWQVAAAGTNVFSNLAGKTSATLSFTAAQSQDGNRYRAVFRNGTGDAVTAEAELVVGTVPAFTSPAAATFTSEGGLQNVTVRATGVPAAVFSVGTLPGWLSLTDHGDGTATLSGTPPTGWTGHETFDLDATNRFGAAATQSFTLTVTSAPVVTLDPTSKQAIAGDAVTFEAAATGHPVPTVQWQVSTTGGTSFTDLAGKTSTTLSFATTLGQNGNLYRAVFSNGAAGSPASTATALLAVGTPPAITSDPVESFRVDGSARSFTVTSTGSPRPTFTLGGSVPAWLSLVDAGDGTASLVGTPPVGSGGTYPLTLTAGNTFGTDAAQNFVLTVREIPTFTSGAAANFEAGHSGSFLVTTAAGFPAPPTVKASGLPAGLRFTDNGDGTATLGGTPAVKTGGVHTVTMTVSNSSGASTQTLTLSIAEAPHFVSKPTATFTHGIVGSFDIETKFGFPAGVAVATGSTLPAGLSLSDNGDGTAGLQGVTLAAPGSVDLVLTAGNGIGIDATQTLTLKIEAAAAVPLPMFLPPGDGNPVGVPATALPGAKLTVTADGFAADAPITFGIYSTPRELATATADASGSATATFALPTDLTGQHTIVVAGLDESGTKRFVTSTITIDVVPGPETPVDPTPPVGPSPPDAQDPSSIASTGVSFDVGGLGGIALLLLVGGALVMWRRRGTNRA